MKHMSMILISLTAAIAMLAPNAALAASTFYGITKHVSMDNIKVYSPTTHQTLSFVLVPKFDEIFSADGKTTYQMKAIKPGRYVGIFYDQKGLGVRHADKIFLLNNENQKIGKE